MTVPLTLISWPVSGVLLSTLARLQGDARRRSDLMCAIVTATAAATFPLMTFLTFGARLPLDLIYGHRWAGLADIVALLAPVGAIQSIAAYNGAILVERGAVRLSFWLAIVNVVGTAGVFVLAHWVDLHTMVLVYDASAIAVSVLLIRFMCRVGQLEARTFISCLIPGSAASLAGVLCALALTGLTPHSWAGWTGMTVIYAAAVLLTFVATRERILGILRSLMVTVPRPAIGSAE
jgi:O-antigen/teichoic acid export membrane protein